MKRRSIKFRGKRIDNGEWVFGFLFRTTVDGMPCNCILNGDSLFDDTSLPEYISMYFTLNKDLFVVVPDTVGQFTGLHDKNGEEIYEGDILQWGEGDYKIKQVVMFLHGAFGYKCDPYTFIPYVGNTNFDFWAKGTDHRFEIIGNTHDNPELMREGGGNQ